MFLLFLICLSCVLFVVMVCNCLRMWVLFFNVCVVSFVMVIVKVKVVCLMGVKVLYRLIDIVYVVEKYVCVVFGLGVGLLECEFEDERRICWRILMRSFWGYFVWKLKLMVLRMRCLRLIMIFLGFLKIWKFRVSIFCYKESYRLFVYN